jgi:hypothetical protein
MAHSGGEKLNSEALGLAHDPGWCGLLLFPCHQQFFGDAAQGWHIIRVIDLAWEFLDFKFLAQSQRNRFQWLVASWAERTPELLLQQIKNVVFATDWKEEWSAQYISSVTEHFWMPLITRIAKAYGFRKPL